SSATPGEVLQLGGWSCMCSSLSKRRFGPPPIPRATKPCHDQDGRAWQTGDEDHDAVDGGGRASSCRTQASRTEYPCRNALTRTPPPDVGQHHGHHHEQRYREH